MTRVTPYILITVLVCFFSRGIDAKEETIEGVWRISKITRDYEEAPNLNPLPSLIIFTKKHYSIVWMPGASAISAFETRWAPTDQEKIQRFGEIVVNTGTYEIVDGHIEVHPIIARRPEFMGGRMIFSINWSSEELVLTLMDEYTFDDVQAPWAKEASGQQHITLSRMSDN